MKEPDDRELLEFAARFAGWRELKRYGDRPELCGRHDDYEEVEEIPDYLNSVDAWLRDVWPKVAAMQFLSEWYSEMNLGTAAANCNASARQRCLALYRALDGKLPGGEHD